MKSQRRAGYSRDTIMKKLFTLKSFYQRKKRSYLVVFFFA